MERCRWFAMILAMGAVLFLLPPSARDAENTAFAQDQGAGMKEPAKSTAHSKGEMEAYKKDMEKELRSLDKKIAVLEKKVKKEESKAGAEAKESWNDVKVKQRAARSKLKDLSAAGQETWEKARADADTALAELKGAYDKAASHFK